MQVEVYVSVDRIKAKLNHPILAETIQIAQSVALKLNNREQLEQAAQQDQRNGHSLRRYGHWRRVDGNRFLCPAEEQMEVAATKQQAWYDAEQRVALAAEQLLSLCEHHQQQWLLPNQQIQTASPTNRS